MCNENTSGRLPLLTLVYQNFSHQPTLLQRRCFFFKNHLAKIKSKIHRSSCLISVPWVPQKKSVAYTSGRLPLLTLVYQNFSHQPTLLQRRCFFFKNHPAKIESKNHRSWCLLPTSLLFKKNCSIHQWFPLLTLVYQNFSHQPTLLQRRCFFFKNHPAKIESKNHRS